MRRAWLNTVVAVTAAGLCLAASACGGSAPPQAQPSDPALTTLLPKEIAQARTIKVGSSLAVPPLYFPGPDGKPDGLLIDLISEAANHLGVTVEWSQVTTGSQPVALSSKKIDMSGSQFDATPDVLKNGNVVTTYNTSTGLLVPADNPKKIAAMTDLCGLTLAVGRGAVTDLAASQTVTKRCTDAGKPAPDVKMFDGAGESQSALRSGRVAGYFVATTVSAYAARTAPQFFTSVLEGGFENVHQGGVLFAKDDVALATAIQAALNAMIKDGSYAKIMEKWQFPQLGITESTLNRAS